MSAAAQTPAPTTEPDTVRASAPMPAALGRVLSVVRKLIDYGRQLARTVQSRAATPGFALFAIPFGTADLAVILARITNGLRRAAALEAMLCRRAARGQDLTPSPIRLPAAPGPRAARQSAAPDALPEPQRADHTEDPRLARLPTEEEIAARLATGLDPAGRRRPVGAVIADICRDLGIVPAHPLWGEVMLVLSGHGGNFMTFWNDVMERMFRWRTDASEADADGWPASPSHPVAACGTGPP
jgi:hypothetical protein